MMREVGGGGGSIAYKALSRADAAHDKMDAHEDLCAVRYGNIHASLAMITRILLWAGSTLVVLLIGLSAWSLKQQASAIDSGSAAMSAKIELLQRKLDDRPPVAIDRPRVQEPAPDGR